MFDDDIEKLAIIIQKMSCLMGLICHFTSDKIRSHVE